MCDIRSRVHYTKGFIPAGRGGGQTVFFIGQTFEELSSALMRPTKKVPPKMR